MKATGIVRRIDDLGRVVIPKELRKACGIIEGDALEILTTNTKQIIFQKYDENNPGINVPTDNPTNKTPYTITDDDGNKHFVLLSPECENFLAWLADNDMLAYNVEWNDGHDLEIETF